MTSSITRPHRPGPVARFLLLCCGANPEHIKERAELNWYCSLGMSVIITAIISGISAVLLATTSFPNLAGGIIIAIGVVWTIVVFNLDRLIVSRPLSSSRFRSKVNLFLVRFLLAAGIAILMAEGVELALFHDEISAQVAIDNRDKADEVQRQYAEDRDEARALAEQTYAKQLALPGETEQRYKDAVSAATTQLAERSREERCESSPEPGCQTGTGFAGPGERSEAAAERVTTATTTLNTATDALNDYILTPKPAPFTTQQLADCGLGASATGFPQKTIDTCQAQLLVADEVNAVPKPPEPDESQAGPLRRIAALSALASGEQGSTIWTVRILLFVILASIDLVPLTAKFVGGTTGHDVRARLDNVEANNAFAEKANRAVHPTPHFLEKSAGHDRFAAKQREQYWEELFANQAAAEKAKWARPDERDRWNENEQVTDDESKKVDTAEAVGPGYVLRTTEGQEFVLTEKLPDAASRWYHLWRCDLRSEPSGAPEFQPGQPFVAKITKRDDKEVEESALVGLNQDVLARFIPNGQDHVVNIVSGEDVQVDESTGLPYIVMQHYPLGDLRQYMKKRWGDEVQLLELMELVRQAMEGLLATHRAGFLHLDIKPANVLVDLVENRPRAILTDFGIAAAIRAFDNAGLTDQDHTFLGTYNYAAIEQVLPAKGFGHRTALCDLWSIGALVFRMVTGQYPREFAEAQALELPRRKSGDVQRRSEDYHRWLEKTKPVAPRLDVLTPGVPTPLADLVEKWLSNEPLRRVSRGALVLALDEDDSDPAALLENRGDPAVMIDALESLDAVLREIR